MNVEVLQKSSYRNVTKQVSAKYVTNLSVELVYVTPEIARNYLKFNKKNRKESAKHLSFLVNQMREGLFLENGESIVFDQNNNLTDGQHRLMAIVQSGKSYFIPIVRGVASNSMATYDTGKNRSAADVLSLNGFTNTHTLSAVIRLIEKYSKKGSKTANKDSYNRSEAFTNQQTLDYCMENYDWLSTLINKVTSIYNKSKFKTIGVSSLSLIAYMIGGKTPSNEVYDYIKQVYGLSKHQDTATSYLNTKLHNAKINKEPLNFYWILGMSIKAWNYFSDGNPSVKYFKFSTEAHLPKINRY